MAHNKAQASEAEDNRSLVRGYGAQASVTGYNNLSEVFTKDVGCNTSVTLTTDVATEPPVIPIRFVFFQGTISKKIRGHMTENDEYSVAHRMALDMVVHANKNIFVGEVLLKVEEVIVLNREESKDIGTQTSQQLAHDMRSIGIPAIGTMAEHKDNGKLEYLMEHSSSQNSSVQTVIIGSQPFNRLFPKLGKSKGVYQSPACWLNTSACELEADSFLRKSTRTKGDVKAMYAIVANLQLRIISAARDVDIATTRLKKTFFPWQRNKKKQELQILKKKLAEARQEEREQQSLINEAESKYKDTYGDSEFANLRDFFVQISSTVLLHEIGHNAGLSHDESPLMHRKDKSPMEPANPSQLECFQEYATRFDCITDQENSFSLPEVDVSREATDLTQLGLKELVVATQGRPRTQAELLLIAVRIANIWGESTVLGFHVNVPCFLLPISKQEADILWQELRAMDNNRVWHCDRKRALTSSQVGKEWLLRQLGNFGPFRRRSLQSIVSFAKEQLERTR